MKPAIYHRRFTAIGIRFLNFLSLSVMIFLSINAHGQRPDINGFAVLRMNEVNSHAARHFLSHFSPTATVKWYQDEQHYVASFKEGDSADRVYYKTNGNFDYCLKYYGAEALDRNLKSSVLEKFPGCQIMTITELTDLEKKNLFIKIKDGAYIRTLSCSNEGIETVENIKNGGS